MHLSNIFARAANDTPAPPPCRGTAWLTPRYAVPRPETRRTSTSDTPYLKMPPPRPERRAGEKRSRVRREMKWQQTLLFTSNEHSALNEPQRQTPREPRLAKGAARMTESVVRCRFWGVVVHCSTSLAPFGFCAAHIVPRKSNDFLVFGARRPLGGAPSCLSSFTVLPFFFLRPLFLTTAQLHCRRFTQGPAREQDWAGLWYTGPHLLGESAGCFALCANKLLQLKLGTLHWTSNVFG